MVIALTQINRMEGKPSNIPSAIIRKHFKALLKNISRIKGTIPIEDKGVRAVCSCVIKSVLISGGNLVPRTIKIINTNEAMAKCGTRFVFDFIKFGFAKKYIQRLYQIRVI